MLVPGLTNETLSAMISSSQGDYSGVYQSLCECAQAMVDRYRQKQVTSENRHKLEVKNRAVTILLQELGKVPKDTDADATRGALLSALERHAEELQGYEHLLSEKGNNYALIKQTQGLRQQAGAPASLLRYHHLKNKLLEPDSPLSAEQKECISELSERKCLRLKMLKKLEKNPDFLTPDIMSFCREVSKLPASKVPEPTSPRGVEADLEQPKIKAGKLKTGMEQLNTYMEQLNTYMEQQATAMEQLNTYMEQKATAMEQQATDVEELETETVLEPGQLKTTMEQLKTKIAVELLKMETILEQLKPVMEQI